MSDLFASGNSIGGSGPGGAGSSGRGAGGAGEYGKGPGGVGEYGTGAGGAGTYGLGAGGSGVGVNYETITKNEDSSSSNLLRNSNQSPYYEDEILNRDANLNPSEKKGEHKRALQTEQAYLIKSPFTYFMLSLFYPVIYIPLALLIINTGIVLIASFITKNPLGVPFIWIVGELVGICVVAYFHHHLMKKVKKQS